MAFSQLHAGREDVDLQGAAGAVLWGISAVPMKLPGTICAAVTGLVICTVQSLVRPMVSFLPSREVRFSEVGVTAVTVPRTNCGAGAGGWLRQGGRGGEQGGANGKS